MDVPENGSQQMTDESNWVSNVSLLWDHRRMLLRVAISIFLLSLIFACLLPNRYESVTRIMPPEQSNGGAAMLAALLGRGAAGSAGSSGGLANLAGSLLGAKSSGALFITLLESGTVRGHLIDRFQLQQVYRKRYVQDTVKMLGSRTVITEDKKSGVLTIAVEDTDRRRARDLTQAYLNELDNLLAKVNTSSAGRERQFIEGRLRTVQVELARAQVELSDFSSRNTAIDIKEQTRAMVDSGAKLQGEMIVGQSELDSLEQIYGDENVRVRAAKARVAVLRQELERESGRIGEEAREGGIDVDHPYPALRQLPSLAAHWADLYRTVRIHEEVFDLLSAQYEMARIEEAKSIPTVSVIDPPSWPEKKSFPHRFLIVLISTACALILAAFFLLAKRSWMTRDDCDPRRVLARRIWGSFERRFKQETA
jgi:capsule polysaccharide export protein KpsE/RkpR